MTIITSQRRSSSISVAYIIVVKSVTTDPLRATIR